MITPHMLKLSHHEPKTTELYTMNTNTFSPQFLKMSYEQAKKPASGTFDLHAIFNQAKPNQDLLRFEHDACDIEPTVSIVQEYARAVRLLFIRNRWSKLGLTDWHSEMQILISARSSTLMGLDIWEPLDDFFDTYVFEMEIQPSSDLDARGRKMVKRGLLKQLQTIATREVEGCHKNISNLLANSITNWRSLDSRLLAFKKKVWRDCEERGSLCLVPANEISHPTTSYTVPSPMAYDIATPQMTWDYAMSPMAYNSPLAYDFSASPTTAPSVTYSDSGSSVTTQGSFYYMPPSINYAPMLQNSLF
jgi:hypothetical protein